MKRYTTYILMLALVLSGGGLFGAWQAGAWCTLAERVQPDLIVGASVGSLNGYLIAGGATPDDLKNLWLDPGFAKFPDLQANIRWMMSRYPLRTSFALTVTDLLRLKPKIFRDAQITWRHLAASCALPGVLPQIRIDGRLYSDGGLLNPLPVWAAVELGATQIVALHALPELPSAWLRVLSKAFRPARHNPPVPAGVTVQMIIPGRALGSLSDSYYWKRDNIERWLAQGAEDVERGFSLA
jgi:predicted acylesterase/phospholipase RssA